MPTSCEHGSTADPERQPRTLQRHFEAGRDTLALIVEFRLVRMVAAEPFAQRFRVCLSKWRKPKAARHRRTRMGLKFSTLTASADETLPFVTPKDVTVQANLVSTVNFAAAGT